MLTSYLLIVLAVFFLIASLKMIKKITDPSLDHFMHLGFIRAIKTNRHRFIHGGTNIIEYRNFMYPQLMHFLLSFIPYRFSETKYLRINFIIELLLSGFTVFFVAWFSAGDPLRTVGIASLLIVTNPFGRFIWNAKVSGISARNFGILTVYLYLFFFSGSFFADQVSLRLAGLVLLGFIIIISGQFATQFLLLFALINIFFGSYLPSIAFPVSLLLFFVLMPKVFLSYVRGQIQHKKIWIKHLAKIDLLKNRYSVYRDFVYDFYKKKSLKYFFSNPLVEVFTGFPVLVALIYVQPHVWREEIVIFSALACFVLTSFRFTRFFGEPQRYVEMALPFIVMAAIRYLAAEHLYIIILFNCIYFIFHINIFGVFFRKEKFSPEIRKRIAAHITENRNETKPLLLGNHWGAPGYFLPEKEIQVMLPTFTSWIQYGQPINVIFPEHLFSTDRNVCIDWIKNYRPGWFFLDDYYWPKEEFETRMRSEAVEFIFNEDYMPVLLYRLKYD